MSFALGPRYTQAKKELPRIFLSSENNYLSNLQINLKICSEQNHVFAQFMLTHNFFFSLQGVCTLSLFCYSSQQKESFLLENIHNILSNSMLDYSLK